MRALLIDDQAKKEVRRVRKWAEQSDHYYRPGITHQVPGDSPQFRAWLRDGFRCVFTITCDRGNKFRHLTISVTGENYPNPIAAFTIAGLFGFEGWDGKTPEPPESWMVAPNKVDHCIVLAQPIETETKQ